MILFITRKYPPSVGGMENLSYQLIAEMKRQTDVRVIAWGRSQKWLPIFVIGAFVQAVAILWTEPVRMVHVGDPVLVLLGLSLRYLSGVPVFTTAHGLDVTFPNRLYQFMIRVGLKRLDGVVCISEYARLECLKRGVSPLCCAVIHPGVVVTNDPRQAPSSCRVLEQVSGRSLVNRSIILSVGRLVERKGFLWFVSQVLPPLVAQCPQVLYFLCGDGPHRRTIEAEVENLGLTSHVCLLGQVEEHVLHAAYTCADVFVMPNIVVAGNPEGFGLVHLEARAAGTPVIAADLEGIRESIVNGVDGILISAGDANGFTQAILGVLNHEMDLLPREQIRARIAEVASWSSVASRYLDRFETWAAMSRTHAGTARS